MEYAVGLVRNSYDNYIFDAKNDVLLDSFSESYTNRSRSLQEVNRLLKNNGFEANAFYDTDSKGPVGLGTRRVLTVSKVER